MIPGAGSVANAKWTMKDRMIVFASVNTQ